MFSEEEQYATFVAECTADLDDAYPMEPGRWPRLRPAIDEMLITEPFSLASRMRRQTCLATSHNPVRFVLMILSHSSSGQSRGECTAPVEAPRTPVLPSTQADMYLVANE